MIEYLKAAGPDSAWQALDWVAEGRPTAGDGYPRPHVLHVDGSHDPADLPVDYIQALDSVASGSRFGGR